MARHHNLIPDDVPCPIEGYNEASLFVVNILDPDNTTQHKFANPRDCEDIDKLVEALSAHLESLYGPGEISVMPDPTGSGHILWTFAGQIGIAMRAVRKLDS